jgi:hypothetical protein
MSLSQPHFEASVRMRLTPKSENLESSGTLATSELDCKGQNTLPWGILYTLERVQNVDVENGLAWAIRTSAAQVMVERKAESQINSLTPDHKKSGIDLIPLCAGEVQHTVGKLLRRAISLLQTSFQSKVWIGSYELPKSRESKLGQFWDSSFGIPRIKAIWMRVLRSNAENTIWGKVVASLESGPWWVKWVRVAHGLSQHQGCFRRWTNPLVVGFWCRTE